MTAIDFSMREEVEDNLFGPLVVVEWQYRGGRTIQEWLPACLAVAAVLDSPGLGDTIVAARILWLGVYDEWSMSA